MSEMWKSKIRKEDSTKVSTNEKFINSTTVTEPDMHDYMPGYASEMFNNTVLDYPENQTTQRKKKSL